jgi:SAM-dependent methyltransferase
MITAAKEYAPDARFEVADVDTYDFPSKIDGIVSFASLLHSNKEQIASVLQRAHTALKPGGIFYISLKKGAYQEHGSDRADEFGTRTYFYYTPEEIKELASGMYEIVLIEEQHRSGQDWFTIVLQKAGE